MNMKDFFNKYARTIILSIIGLVVLAIILKVGNYVYMNSYTNEKFVYTTKSSQNQTFDQNVKIEKQIKRNATEGEFVLKFDKKDLTEEYAILVDPKLNTSNIELSIIGKITNGNMNVRMADDKNKDIFNKNVVGPNIKEISTSQYRGSYYKFIFTPSGAVGGDLKIKYKIN